MRNETNHITSHHITSHPNAATRSQTRRARVVVAVAVYPHPPTDPIVTPHTIHISQCGFGLNPSTAKFLVALGSVTTHPSNAPRSNVT